MPVWFTAERMLALLAAVAVLFSGTISESVFVPSPCVADRSPSASALPFVFPALLPRRALSGIPCLAYRDPFPLATAPTADDAPVVAAATATSARHAKAATLVRFMLRAARAAGLTDRGQIAYILATAEHETDRWATLVEYGERGDFSAYQGILGNAADGDGWRYRGRGFVQMTGRANYARFSRLLGVDLVSTPDLAARPDIAAKVAILGMMRGSFTGLALPRFLGGGKADFIGARAVVNGRDRNARIAAYAFPIYSALAQVRF